MFPPQAFFSLNLLLTQEQYYQQELKIQCLECHFHNCTKAKLQIDS